MTDADPDAGGCVVRHARTVVALLLVGSLLAPVGAVVVGAQQGGGDAADSSGSPTLEELQRGGQTISNSPESLRIVDGQMWWMIHWPANDPTANPGEDGKWTHLGPGDRVQRNAVYLRSYILDDARTETVNIAYWEKGTRTVKQGNTTTSEPIAENVSVHEHQVTMPFGRPTVEIPLQQHDRPVQVTMWLEGQPDVRWRFEHQSIATTQSAGIDSEGDYLSRVLMEFIIPVILGTFGGGFGIKKMLDRAGAGPQWGFAPWIILLTIVTGAGVLWGYSSLADLIVMAPTVLALYVVGVICIIILETYTSGVSRSMFLQPVLEAATSPTGEDAHDMTRVDMEEHKTVRMSDGSTAILKPGLLPFLARAFGRAARLEGADELNMITEMPNSKWDRLYYVHPEAEEVIHYDSEGWSFEFPSVSRDNAVKMAAGVGLLGFGAYAAATYSGPTVAAVGVVGAVAAVTLTPQEGEAWFEPAPAHMRSAHSTMMMLTEETRDAETIDEAREQLLEERLTFEQQVEDRIEDSDSTLIEVMNGADVDKTIRPSETVDEVVEEFEADDTEEVSADD
jgi:hypothetical protein